jgi:hypothetical protein
MSRLGRNAISDQVEDLEEPADLGTSLDQRP